MVTADRFYINDAHFFAMGDQDSGCALEIKPPVKDEEGLVPPDVALVLSVADMQDSSYVSSVFLSKTTIQDLMVYLSHVLEGK